MICSDSFRDTYGYLYDIGMNELTHDDGGSERNFSITRTLTDGTTYLIGDRFYNSNVSGSIPVRVRNPYRLVKSRSLQQTVSTMETTRDLLLR